MEYPVKYDLDNFYFQVERNGQIVNVCLSDMTTEELQNKAKYWNKENLMIVVEGLCKSLRDLGDRYGFVANDEDRLSQKDIYENSRYR